MTYQNRVIKWIFLIHSDNSVTAADPQSNQVTKKPKKNQNPSAPSSQPQKHGNPKITGGTLYVQIEGQLIDFILKNFEVSEDINRYVAVDFNSFCLVAVTHQTTYYGDFATDLLNTCLKSKIIVFETRVEHFGQNSNFFPVVFFSEHFFDLFASRFFPIQGNI